MAGTTVGEAFVKIRPDTKGFGSDLDRQVGGQLDGIGSKFATLGKVAAAAVAATGVGLAAIGKYALSAAGDMQQVEIAFEGILGSGEKAQAFLTQMRDFAAKTPFEFPELARAAKMLLAVGYNAEDVIPVMTKLGNVAAVLGAGGAEIEGVVRALGQMKGKGKASAEELEQISGQLPGFSAIKAIAEKMGVSVADAMDSMSKGAVSADTAIEAILEGMEKFPGAAGAMERQSKTLNGVLSTLKDTVTQALVEGVAPILPAIADTVNDAVPQIKTGIGVIAETIATLVKASIPVIKAVLPMFVVLGETVGKLVTRAFDTLGPLMERLAPKFDALVRAVEPLLEAVVDTLLPALEELAPAFVDVGTRAAVSMLPIMQALSPVIVLIAQALAKLVDVLGPAGGAMLIAAFSAGRFQGGLTAISTAIPNLVSALAAMPAAFGPWGLAVAGLITTMAILLDTSGLNDFEVALKGSADTLRDVILQQRSLTGDATTQWVQNYLKQKGTLNEFNKVLAENGITMEQFMAKFATATDGTMGWARSLGLSSHDAWVLAGAITGMDSAFIEAQQSALDAAKVNGDLATMSNIASSMIEAEAAAMRQMQKDTGTTELSLNGLLNVYRPGIEAVKKLAGATVAQGGTFADAAVILEDYRNKLVWQMVASGIAEGKAKDLANAMLGINEASPALATVVVDTNTAQERLDRLKRTLGELAAVGSVEIQAALDEKGLYFNGEQVVPKAATGGFFAARPGGVLANIAEGREDEFVLPVSKLQTMLNVAATTGPGGGASGDVFHIYTQSTDAVPFALEVSRRKRRAMFLAGR